MSAYDYPLVKTSLKTAYQFQTNDLTKVRMFSAVLQILFVKMSFYCVSVKVEWYPKGDQKVCLNMVKKDQLCTLHSRNGNKF